jgi:20S proteasome alpha/beta subunit
LTLILGLICADGAVLTSDSQATFLTGGQEVKGLTRKLVRQWSNVAWGASGNVGVAQWVEALFANHNELKDTLRFDNRGAATVKRDISDALLGALNKYYREQVIPLPNQDPRTAFLFCGWVRDGPVLFEVGQDLVVTDHLQTGFAAIGSGDIFPYFALASLQHHDPTKCSLPRATLIAHRVVDDAIRVAAHGLGPPVQMITIEKGKQAQVRDDIEQIADGVETWKRIEREALSKHIPDTAPEEAVSSENHASAEEP